MMKIASFLMFQPSQQFLTINRAILRSYDAVLLFHYQLEQKYLMSGCPNPCTYSKDGAGLFIMSTFLMLLDFAPFFYREKLAKFPPPNFSYSLLIPIHVFTSKKNPGCFAFQLCPETSEVQVDASYENRVMIASSYDVFLAALGG